MLRHFSLTQEGVQMLKRMSCIFDVFFIDICIDFGIERFLNREAMENFNGENE